MKTDINEPGLFLIDLISRRTIEEIAACVEKLPGAPNSYVILSDIKHTRAQLLPAKRKIEEALAGHDLIFTDFLLEDWTRDEILAAFPPVALTEQERLIAAAPALLEAIKDLLTICNTRAAWLGLDEGGPVMDKARAAIAKAEGSK